MKMLRFANLLVCILLQHSGICNANLTVNLKMGKSFVLKWNIEKCLYPPNGPIFF